MSNNKRPVTGANWSTKKLFIVTWAGCTGALLTIILPTIVLRSMAGAWITSFFSAAWGLTAAIFAGQIGSSLYESNRRLQVWLMTKLWRYDEVKIQKQLYDMEHKMLGIPNGYKFNIFITRFVGILFIGYSVFVVLLAKGLLGGPGAL